MLHRRGFIIGLASALAAPAIVHAGNLMPIKKIASSFTLDDYNELMNSILNMYFKEWHERIAASSIIYSSDCNGLAGAIIRTTDVYNPLGIKVEPIWAKDFYR